MADEDRDVIEQSADDAVTPTGRHIALEFAEKVDSGDKVG